VGDVRGVLEVTLPLASVEKHTESGMRRMITLLLLLGGAGAAAVLMIVHTRTAGHQRLKEAHEDLKRTQEQLVHAGRLAGLGELGAGIAHELNQPLAAIKTLSELMLVEPEADHAADHRLILSQTERMSKIVDNVRSFARQTPLELVSIDPADPLRAALELVEEQLRVHGVTLILDVPDEIPTVLADTASLQQVFLNLIVNARDALDSVQEGEKVLRISVKEENGLVVYSFVDSGPGLTPELAGRIFDPFFTTKPTGKGTGLGLSLSHGIVEKHGGSIRCKPKSALGGAEFVVRIPRGDFA
jgi:C4-dicarboxylate-specific signal transduction histidine kinase